MPRRRSDGHFLGHGVGHGRPPMPSTSTSRSTRVRRRCSIYTAAFAGRPNAAMLSHTGVHRAGHRVRRTSPARRRDDVYLNSGPMFHLGTLMHTLATFVAGGTNVFVPRVDAELLCRIIERERCTGAFLVGPMFDQILEVNAGGGYDLSSLRSAPGRAGVGRDGQPGHEPVGRAPRWLRPDRGGRHDDVQLPRARRGRDARAPLAPARRSASSTTTTARCRRARSARSWRAASDRHERLLEPARRERASGNAAAGTTRTTSAGAKADGSITLHRAEGAHDQVRRREHLPGRGRGVHRARTRPSPSARSSASPTRNGCRA